MSRSWSLSWSRGWGLSRGLGLRQSWGLSRSRGLSWSRGLGLRRSWGSSWSWSWGWGWGWSWKRHCKARVFFRAGLGGWANFRNLRPRKRDAGLSDRGRGSSVGGRRAAPNRDDLHLSSSTGPHLIQRLWHRCHRDWGWGRRMSMSHHRNWPRLRNCYGNGQGSTGWFSQRHLCR